MKLDKRQLGSTGFQATVLGIGDLADRSVPLEECVGWHNSKPTGVTTFASGREFVQLRFIGCAGHNAAADHPIH
jgi:hypothetical protein